MAKALKKIKLTIKAPKILSVDTSPSPSPDLDNDYQTRDDANKIRDYAQLTQDPGRHQAAISHIQNEHRAISHIQNEHRAMRGVISGESLGDSDDEEDSGMTPRTTSRLGRKTTSRVASRGGGR